MDNEDDKFDCNNDEDEQLLGPYLESSLTPDNQIEAATFSPNIQHFQSFD